MTIEIAKRNRLLKTVLEAKYGRGNVRVQGSRGTGYGWVSATIKLPSEASVRSYSEAYAEVETVAKAGGVEFYTYSSDMGDKHTCFNVSFERSEPVAQAAA